MYYLGALGIIIYYFKPEAFTYIQTGERSPLDIIVELRRSLVMEESNAPAEWNGMFSNIENNFAPWKFAPDDRDAWTKQ